MTSIVIERHCCQLRLGGSDFACWFLLHGPAHNAEPTAGNPGSPHRYSLTSSRVRRYVMSDSLPVLKKSRTRSTLNSRCTRSWMPNGLCTPLGIVLTNVSNTRLLLIQRALHQARHCDSHLTRMKSILTQSVPSDPRCSIVVESTTLQSWELSIRRIF